MGITGKMLLINLLNIVYLKFFKILNYRICILDSENICSLLHNDPKIYSIFLRIYNVYPQNTVYYKFWDHWALYTNKQETSKLNSRETAQNIEKHF